jgi:7,8-dihydropterin-6-yl-methyl-4-(beta-D-ribofuranosyl)aminobenzene 5'-phosphate synthase
MDENKIEVPQNTISRRNFLEWMGVGTVGGFIGGMGAFSYTPARKQFFPKSKVGEKDIGEVKKLTITCVSETSWFDNARLTGDFAEMGGLLVNQWTYPWPPAGKPGNPAGDWHAENAGGYAALIEVELLDGDKKFILLDTGWGFEWTDQRYKDTGVDKMLQNGEIDCLFVSHEHFDHFWGLPATMKYKNDIDMYIGGDYYPEGKQFIKDSGFTGKLYETQSMKKHDFPIFDKKGKQIPGVAGYYFPIGIICRVMGEQSLYFNVKDHGYVQVTGCCHQGILQMAEACKSTFKNGDNLYGVYGGLHISPFEDWDPRYDDLVFGLGVYDFKRIGCNHCTGVLTARKFVAAGYPVVTGTASHRTKCTEYLGNGDQIVFGA